VTGFQGRSELPKAVGVQPESAEQSIDQRPRYVSANTEIYALGFALVAEPHIFQAMRRWSDVLLGPATQNPPVGLSS
jgi:hypothetical protein